MKLRPLGDRLIVSAASKNEVTASGIVLPETSKERPEQGTVIAAGPGRLDQDGKQIPMSVKVGDKVMFKKYSPDEINVDGQDYLVLSESDILAVIE
ncbi:co-chaperone GroES [Candidatus Uhrbacteria bacterium]|nr:co-chaperone GroES [Candidatus Uhrbacteria bacterium]